MEAVSRDYAGCSQNYGAPQNTWRVSGTLVSRLIRGITGVTIWVIGVNNLLTKSP